MKLRDIADVSDLDIDVVKDQIALVRVSFDAFDSKGNIEDGLRIEAAEPTIKLLKQKGIRNIILMTYAGRPDKNATDKTGDNSRFIGKLYDKRLSVRPAADFLHGMMKERIHFISALDDYGNFYENASEYVGHVKKYMEKNVEEGDVILLDNLRFWDGENNGDKPVGREFARLIASLGAVYVQDGFAQAHRINNATVGEITKHTKVNVLGVHIRAEIEYLTSIFDNLITENRNPFVFIVGGKKIETKPGIVSKIDVINKVAEKMKTGDKILIGGAMSFPFILAEKYLSDVNRGKEHLMAVLTKEKIRGIIGDSYIAWDQIYDQIMLAGMMLINMDLKRKQGIKITVKLPVDHCVLKDGTPFYVERLSEGLASGDIGVKTLDEWKKQITDANTILLAGPVGIYENKAFSQCSKQLVGAIAATTGNTVTIAAGGDTADMVRSFGYGDKFSLVSIGGGATLEFLMQGYLPSLTLLDTKEKIKAFAVAE